MKHWKPFFSGALAMALILSLTGAAFAAAGKLQIGTGGVIVMDRVRLESGEAYTADAEKIPAYVIYEGASGRIHNYVPVEMIADYLDIPSGWSEKRNSVVLGPTSEGAVYQILTGEELRSSVVKAPVYGAKAGPFTEIDPSTVDMSEGPTGIFEDETAVESWMGFDTARRMSAIGGTHLVLTIANNGDTPVISRVGRAFMINGFEGLSQVKIEPGQTLTRAFAIDGDVDRIHNEFLSSVMPETVSRIKLTVSLKRYR